MVKTLSSRNPRKSCRLFINQGGTTTQIWAQTPQNSVFFRKSIPTGFQDIPTVIKKYAQLKKLYFKEIIAGVRGVWTKEERGTWEKKCRGLAPKITVLSDVEFEHQLIFGKSPGVILIAGTGAIAYGRSFHGKHARAGGLGPLLGDEGSGFWVGRSYLKWKVKKEGGWKIARNLASGPNPVQKIASLAKMVLTAAEKKPKSHLGQFRGLAIGYLMELLQELTTTLKMKGRVPLYLSGGLFNNQAFKNLFIRRLPSRFVLVRV